MLEKIDTLEKARLHKFKYTLEEVSRGPSRSKINAVHLGTYNYDRDNKDSEIYKVIEYAMHDDRLGYSHWMVPGPDGDFGYGGHCFPKDVKALIYVAQELGVPAIMLTATDLNNNEVRKDRDWEKQKGRAVL